MALSACQREAVLLVYYHGCTYRESASFLGIPIGTLKTRVHDARAKLLNSLSIIQD